MLLAIKAAQRFAALYLALSSALFASPPIATTLYELAVSKEAFRSSKLAQTQVEPFPFPTGIFVSRATAAKCLQNKPTKCRNICIPGSRDYCDVYLTHDSMSVRKAHNSGRNHLRNVVEYYQQIGQEKAQSVIDSITSSYAAEGQPLPNPAMVPGAFPPPFGFPGLPGQGPPPPFGLAGLPPPGAPGAPGMLPRKSTRSLPYRPENHGQQPADNFLFYQPAPGGLPFPPPFPGAGATGTPPTGGFPPPSQHARRSAPAPRWVPCELPDPSP
ncbi:uncharacterized protein N7477_009963, partial [Penicillium maclennaniae]|uniref:uncharacterized protein n=1 Tax=Penicillium maclennaniae TaxID=1343394 RepID=UPI00253FDD19